MMFRTTYKQLFRPITKCSLSSSNAFNYRYPDWRLFCSNESKHNYGGLSINDKKVLDYLRNAKTEYDDLVKRKETLGRDGHNKIRELQKMVEIYEKRNAAIENLRVLDEEMSKEKDVDLLAMMKDEKTVSRAFPFILTFPNRRSLFPGIFSVHRLIEP